jgi:folate-binding protein YgfZ
MKTHKQSEYFRHRTRKPVNLAYLAATTGLAFRHRHEQGILRVTGRDRLAWLNGLLTNDVITQTTCYAAWLTPQGRMITDMFVASSGHETLLEVPAPLAASLATRLDGLIFTEDARLTDVSDELMAVEVCGPSAPAGLEAVKDSLPDGMSIDQRVVTRPLPGVVVYVPRKQFPGVLEALTHSGATPLDDLTAEILRVEAGVPRFLVDMGEDTIPLEAGLDHAISHTKGCYVGQEIIVRIRDRAHGRVARHLTGLRIEGDDVPAVDQPVLRDGRQVGRLTSAVRSAALDAPIGLAIVHRDASDVGTRVEIGAGLPAVVAALPFTNLT